MTTVAWLQNSKYSQHVERASNYEECLLQLFYGVTWDGDLISKQHRDEAVLNWHAQKIDGWNYITESGIAFLIAASSIRI